MNLKRFILYHLLLTLSIMTFGSDTLTISEAKTFYESFQTEENNYIFWDDFITFKDKEGQSYIFVSYVSTKDLGATIEDSRKSGNNYTVRPTSLIFKKENGNVTSFKTFLLMDEDRHRMFVDKYFSGYVTLSNLTGKLIEMILYDEGKLTYSSKAIPKEKSIIKICLQLTEINRLLDKVCADVYGINESEYTGLLGSILEPRSQKTLNDDKSFDKFIEHLTPDSLKAQGKRVQIVPDN